MQGNTPSQQPQLLTLSPDCFASQNDDWDDIRRLLLSICLWHNDIVSIIKLDDFVETLKPADNSFPTIEQGDYGGLRTYLDRLYASTLNEFLYLVKKNKDTMRSAHWLKIEQALDKDIQQNWEYLKQVAHGKEIKSEVFEPLVKLRNHIGFHYAAKQLHAGYRAHLERTDISAAFQKAFIKNGNAGNRIRFYFADAAAQAYYRSIVNITNEKDSPWTKLIKLLPNVTAGLFRSFLEIKKSRVIMFPAKSDPIS